MDSSEKELSSDRTEQYSLDGMTDRLLTWYSLKKRDLPWRENPSPYRVWISEIMLQQTRIEAVKSYFERFMEAFPSVRDLAEAEEERVLKLWEGLGYYSRARNLKKAAMLCESEYDGKLPDTYQELMRLPGIGSYTAGAVASIACGRRVPAIDGNVCRVMTRLMADGGDISKAPVKKRIWDALMDLIPEEAPGDFNSALMELGETVCIPRGKPLCKSCPLQPLCRAEKMARQEEFPLRPEKKARRIEKRTVFLIRCRDRYAIRRRPGKGLLAGLYELPSLAGHLDLGEVRALLQGDLSEAVIRELPKARHIFSHVEWDMRAFLIETAKEWKGDWFYAGKDEIEELYALPSAFGAFRSYLK